jgi:hypothetical protein
MKIRGNSGCLKLFISSLTTLIFIHYLATGFVDVVLTINSILAWWQRSGVGEFIYRLLGGR